MPAFGVASGREASHYPDEPEGEARVLRAFLIVLAAFSVAGEAAAACVDDPITYMSVKWAGRQKHKQVSEYRITVAAGVMGQRITIAKSIDRSRGSVMIEYPPVQGRRIRSYFSESHVITDDSGAYFFQGYLEVFAPNLEQTYRTIAQDDRYKRMVTNINRYSTDPSITISYSEFSRPNYEGSSAILVDYRFPSIEAFCDLSENTVMNGIIEISDIMASSMLPIMEEYDLNRP